jgi:hypothetical protein
MTGSMISVLIIVLIVFVNSRLYYSPSLHIIGGNSVDYDRLCQLRHLRDIV